MKLIQVPFRDYYRNKHPKNQIYLHHTAGADNAYNVIQGWWSRTKVREGTCVVIERDGDVMQGFSSKYWAYHLGIKMHEFKAIGTPYRPLDRFSIGIELTNWGGLVKKGQKYYNYLDKEVHKDEVIKLSFKGYKYYHDYTEEQIQAVKELLELWKEKYSIDISYNKDIWDITDRALKGEDGVFTHNSVRSDKNDVYPHPKLISMLKTL